ncbi:MAG: YceI family protein [Fimbriimonadaceae bacterium]
MKKHLLATLLLVPVAAIAVTLVSARDYSLKDPKSVNAIRFVLDARFEHIGGYTTAIDGNIAFDPEAPEKTTGKVVVQADQIQMHHLNMNEHIKQEMWLDTAKHPTIEFVATKATNVKKIEGPDPEWTMDVTGDFTMKGVTKQITIPVRIAHMPGQLAKRNRGATGDLMAVRSSFTIKRSDYGVNGNQPLDIVADEIQVSFSLAAFNKTN